LKGETRVRLASEKRFKETKSQEGRGGGNVQVSTRKSQKNISRIEKGGEL